MSKTTAGVLFLAASLAAQVVCAQSAGVGTTITNQATADYYDVAKSSVSQAQSNVASIDVGANFAVDLIADRNISATAGSPVTLNHTLTNIGNADDSYDLAVSNQAGDDYDINQLRIYYDQNSNGQLDSGESEISTTQLIVSGQSIQLLITGTLPSSVATGSQAKLAVSATSRSDGTVSDSNLDTVNVVDGSTLPSIVFDAVNHTPLAGAAITVRDSLGNVATDPTTGGTTVVDTVSSDSSGHYYLPKLYPGTYYLDVAPPTDYRFPSEVAPSTLGSVIIDGRTMQVSESSYGQNGHGNVAHSGEFTLTAGDATPIIDIPLDYERYEFTPDPDDSCTAEVDPGSQAPFALELSNLGLSSPTERAFVLDGATVSGVMIENEIPANTTLHTQTVSKRTPQAAIPVIKYVGDLGNDNWYSLNSWDGSGTVAKVGLFVQSQYLTPSSSVNFEFGLTVNDKITTGTKIRSRAVVDFDGDGVADVEGGDSCYTVKDLDNDGDYNAALITFMEPMDSWRQECSLNQGTCQPLAYDSTQLQEATFYHVDNYSFYLYPRDAVYIEVQSTSLNSRSYAEDQEYGSETLKVTLTSNTTGDDVDVVIKETGPNTGVFRSVYPVRLTTSDNVDTAKAALGKASSSRVCSDTNTQSCYLISIDADELQAKIDDPGTGAVIVDAAVVDPLGVVFDTGTGQPVSGATVSVRDSGGNLALNPDTGGATTLAPQVTGSDGGYHYPRLYPGTYYVHVQPPSNYDFPSNIPKSSNLFDNTHASYLGDLDGRAIEVNDYSYGQDGYNGVAGSGQFTLNAGDPILVIDVPLDYNGTGNLVLSKSANVEQIGIGGVVSYELRLRYQNLAANLTGAVIEDTLPYGFRLQEKTLQVDGNTVTPTHLGSNRWQIPIGTMTTDQEVVITYAARVTAGALDSDGVNVAQASGTPVAGALQYSNIARAKVEVTDRGLFSDDGYVFGKIFIDSDNNNLQNNAEPAIPGVRLYMEDGTSLITDENGQYSLYGLNPGQHVIRVDTTTLPDYVTLMPIDNRHGADPRSRFVDITSGELHRADFVVNCPDKDIKRVMEEIAQRQKSVNSSWMLDESLKAIEQASIRERDAYQARNDQVASEDGDLSRSVTDSKSAAMGGAQVSDQEQVAQAQLKERRGIDVEALAPTITQDMARSGHWVWPEQESEISRDGRFIVVVRAGVKPSLYVNGERVAEEKLGEQIVNKAQRAQILGWYGVELQERDNLVQVKAEDMFGNERILAERRVSKPGAPHRLRLIPNSDRVEADGGRSVVPITIRLEDKYGVSVSGLEFVTLDNSDGYWLEVDIADKIRGHQVRLQDGEAKVHLRSSMTVGKVQISASANDGQFEDGVELTFAEPMRPLIANGIVDLTARQSWLNDAGRAPSQPRAEVEEGSRVDGRAAMFMKGKVKGDALLTLSYDSEKDEDELLFRDIQPGEYYPVFGDASVKGFDGQSRSKLYARLERDDDSIMWGDFRTDHDSQLGIGRVQRSLTGANAHWEGERLSLSAFAAEETEDHVTETLRGNGTAANYRLSNAVVSHSETVTLVVRDRDNSGLTLSERQLRRFDEYQLDPVLGYLTFIEPIPSFDSDGNPIYIRVEYSAQNGGTDYLFGGLRAGYRLSDSIELNASMTRDEHTDDGYTLSAMALRWQGEEATSYALFEAGDMTHLDGSDRGRAWRFAVNKSWESTGTQLSGQIGAADSGFTQSGSPVAAGQREFKADLVQKLDHNIQGRVGVMSSRNMQNGTDRQSLDVNVEQKYDSIDMTYGWRHTERNGDPDDETLDTLRGRIGNRFTMFDREANAFFEHERDFRDVGRHRSEIGLDWRAQEKVKLYTGYESITSLNGVTGLTTRGETNRFKLGLESDWLPQTRIYSEYRQRGGISGREYESASGTRGSYELEEGLDLTPALEYVTTDSNGTSSSATALSVGLTDTRDANFKQSYRAESRMADNSDYYRLTARYIGRINLDWTSAIYEDYSVEMPSGSSDEVRNLFAVGIAHRPRLTNRYHWLGYYKWRLEKNVGSFNREEAHALSTHHNLELSEAMIVSARLAAKKQSTTVNGVAIDADIQMLDGRFTWDLTRRLDIDIHGGALSTSWGESYLFSSGLGVNYLVRRNLRFGVGYNFNGFYDRDLDEERYNAPGLYAGIQWKFGEELFDWLGPQQ